MKTEQILNGIKEALIDGKSMVKFSEKAQVVNEASDLTGSGLGIGGKYYFDDAFYMLVGMDPKIIQDYVHIERDYELEEKVYNELIVSKGIHDYHFVHEKNEENIRINRELLKPDYPIITAEPQYEMFSLLKVIENAKSVNIISSSFLSLMMCKKYNENVIAHMYCDRQFISPYVNKHNIKTL